MARRDRAVALHDSARAPMKRTADAGRPVVLDAPSPLHLIYRPGVPLIHMVYVAGARRA